MYACLILFSQRREQINPCSFGSEFVMETNSVLSLIIVAISNLVKSEFFFENISIFKKMRRTFP